MPKVTEGGSTSQNYYRISPLSVPTDLTSPRQYPSIASTMQSNMNSQHMSQSGLSPYATGGPVQPLQYHQQPLPQSSPLPVRASSGAWTPSDDVQLMSARAQGLNWQPIQSTYFPNKTPNACRKRHERLMDRRNSDDWDGIKLENLAKEYMGMRREIWTQLGMKTGEKWAVVEAKCMQSGLKNLQSAARACARRERLESPHGQGHPHPGHSHHASLSGSGSSLLPVQYPHDPHSTDDSGIGLDELDADYPHSAGGDTNGSVSGYGGGGGRGGGGGGMGSASASPDEQELEPRGGGGGGGGGVVKLYPAPVRGSGGVRGGGGYDPRDGYGGHMMGGGGGRGADRGYGGQQQQHHQQHQQHQQQQGAGMQSGRQQYAMHHHHHHHAQRLPSIDMGIGAIINRPPGSL